ncbi:MAG TPA: MBL fold metallo-hydrolase [Thermoanaerobaculia bacterium]|jgi:beta-lactamase superfamily II metal-dependent hydrolase|nr:MBL fold metallo-hydrolase [Thermoanaerobaculia bacterium]
MGRRVFVLVAVLAFSMIVPALAGDLEIHVIDVGWGSSVLVRGADGTTVLMDSGDKGKGARFIKPYLESIGMQPDDGIDYTIAGHLHDDHIGGFDEVIGTRPGLYDVHIQNYYNGSTYTGASEFTKWRNAARSTTARRAVVMQVGTRIPLGEGATLTCVARNGSVIGGKKVAPKDENDRSIAVVIQYGGFDYFWASDMGGGSTDSRCTGRKTDQADVESSVIKAILPGGAHPLISKGGIDVLQVSHHGSESSTNANLVNGAAPAVAIISTGDGQRTNFQLPRKVVVDKVLAARVPCVTVAAPLVLQTEEGSPRGARTSTKGFSVGNIVIRTDGKATFTIEADGKVSEGPNEVAAARLPRTFDIDEVKEP